MWFSSPAGRAVRDGREGRDDGAIPFTRSIFIGSVAHQQSARVTCERQKGQQDSHHFFEGIAQSAERVLHMHQVEGAIPSALTISVPVV